MTEQFVYQQHRLGLIDSINPAVPWPVITYLYVLVYITAQMAIHMPQFSGKLITGRATRPHPQISFTP